MIYLKNKSRREIYIGLDHAAGKFQFVENRPEMTGVSGFFDYCEGHFLALYKYADCLYLLCNSTMLPFNENLKMSLLDEDGPHRTTLKDEKKKRLVVSCEGREQINILYPKLQINHDLEEWIQPVADAELLDFCYWIYRVWKERRDQRLLDFWS